LGGYVKKIFLLVVLAICVCFMQGCNSKQLNERMIIQGIGIDYIEDEYKVTVMYMNTDEGQQDITHKTTVGSGRTVTEAVASIVSQNGLEPLYSHNSFILLGNGLCREGVEEAMEFFAGYYQCRPSVNVLTAENEANEIMMLEGITPRTISDIADSENADGRTLAMPMYIFMSDILNETTTACTSVITAENDVPRSDGVALFKGDKLIKTLGSSDAMGVMLVRGESDITAEVIPLDGKSKSFALSQENTEINVRVEKGVLYCNIFIKGEATVYEYTSTSKELEGKIEERLNKIAENAISACTESGADVFYLGKRLRQSDYEMYCTINDWSSLIKNGVYTVSSEVSL